MPPRFEKTHPVAQKTHASRPSLPAPWPRSECRTESWPGRNVPCPKCAMSVPSISCLNGPGIPPSASSSSAGPGWPSVLGRLGALPPATASAGGFLPSLADGPPPRFGWFGSRNAGAHAAVRPARLAGGLTAESRSKEAKSSLNSPCYATWSRRSRCGSPGTRPGWVVGVPPARRPACRCMLHCGNHDRQTTVQNRFAKRDGEASPRQ